MRLYSFLLGPQVRSEQCLLQELKAYPELTYLELNFPKMKVFRYQVPLVRWFRWLALSVLRAQHLG
jgi:hypothetical protein